MKKAFIILAALFIMVSCSSDDKEESVKNPFINTSWKADDPIASVIYGSGCTTTIEFLTETTCQQIDYIPSGPFKGTEVTQGTYVYTGNTVTWTVKGSDETATLSGSVLISTIVIQGNPITYYKN